MMDSAARKSTLDQIATQELSGSRYPLDLTDAFRSLCAHATRLENRVVVAEAAHAEAQARNRELRSAIVTALDSLASVNPATAASSATIVHMRASLIAALDVGSSARTVSK